MARQNEVTTENKSTGAIHTPTGNTEEVPALPGINVDPGPAAVADLREERPAANTGPGVVTPSSAPTGDERGNRPPTGEAPVISRRAARERTPVEPLSKREDGVRHTAEAWWCNKCGNSQTYSFEQCANCGTARPKLLDNAKNR